MWRLVKKWWLLQNLDKEISRHSTKSPIHELVDGKRVLLTQGFFILGTEKYPGIANKSIRRFSWLLWWRRKYNPEKSEKLKKRVNEYNALFKSCIDDGYIKMENAEKNILMPITTNLANDIHGLSGLIQVIGQKFNRIWYLLGAIITFIIGKYWDNVITFLFK